MLSEWRVRSRRYGDRVDQLSVDPNRGYEHRNSTTSKRERFHVLSVVRHAENKLDKCDIKGWVQRTAQGYIFCSRSFNNIMTFESIPETGP